MKITVYIIEYSDGSFHTGLSKHDVEANIWEHNAGLFNACARDHHPVKLVYHEKYDRLTEAVDRARKMKDWDRAQILALVADSLENPPCDLPLRTEKHQNKLFRQLDNLMASEGRGSGFSHA